MSLTAALFKAGFMTPVEYGGSVTKDLSLDRIESMINVYQMSQSSVISFRGPLMENGDQFDSVLAEMFQMGQNIGRENSVQQPYLVYLLYKNEGKKRDGDRGRWERKKKREGGKENKKQ